MANTTDFRVKLEFDGAFCTMYLKDYDMYIPRIAISDIPIYMRSVLTYYVRDSDIRHILAHPWKAPMSTLRMHTWVELEARSNISEWFYENAVRNLELNRFKKEE